MKKIIHSSLALTMLLLSACQTMPQTAESASTAELRNTLWKLVNVAGKSVQTAEGQRMASLTLDSQEARARIATACNNGSAAFSTEGDTIRFSPVMSTKMACPGERMQQESEFFKVIEDTSRYAIKGETLELYNADNQLLATFHSEYLK